MPPQPSHHGTARYGSLATHSGGLRGGKQPTKLEIEYVKNLYTAMHSVVDARAADRLPPWTSPLTMILLALLHLPVPLPLRLRA